MRVEARGLSKSYGALHAVRDVSLLLAEPQLHAILGENGAGKSTLLKLLAGHLRPDSGTVRADEFELTGCGAAAARGAGVGMVHQHFAQVESENAVDNVWLAAPHLSRVQAAAALERAQDDLGFRVPTSIAVAQLGVGDRQRLEVLRAVALGSRFLLLDEPTAVLTPQEADKLYYALKLRVRQGTTVVVVTHSIREVCAFADQVSIMRRGQCIATLRIDADTEPQALIALAMGPGAAGAASGAKPSGASAEPAVAEVAVAAPSAAAPGVALEITALHAGDRLRDFSCTVHLSEIVGLAGVEGQGQDELWAALGGLLEAQAGQVGGAPRAVLYGDRQREGLVMNASLADNVLLGDFAAFARTGVISTAAFASAASARLEVFGLAARAAEPVSALSGGNQQKVVVARTLAAFSAGVRAFALAHPTRGVDLSARAHIHAQLRALRADGAGLLIQSSDLDELRALCDRIVVVHAGRVVAVCDNTADDAELGAWMLGSAPHAVAEPAA